jgi:hypothetical protein
MSIQKIGNSIAGAASSVRTALIGSAALAVNAILAAVTDTAVEVVITTGIGKLRYPRRITATAGGTAGDIKAIQVVIAGKDPRGVSITETLPAFTVNTAGTVIGTKVFASVTSVTIPAHDGLGATTSIGAAGFPAVADDDGILPAVTDTGDAQVITTGIIQPDVPRNVTATAGGTAGDIKAVQVIVVGTDAEDQPLSETLPAFTVNTGGAVAGSKAFKTVTSITLPAHDGTGATTAIGFGEKLGLGRRLQRNTVRAAYLDNVLEGTAPTVAVSASTLASNTADLNSALNSTPVQIEYTSTPVVN